MVTAAAGSLVLRSAAFADGAEIPTQYTCEGADASPALEWSGVPAGAKTLLYDIPTDAAGLPEAVGRGALPAGTRQGVNDWKRTGWGGPCPPIGRHRYFFKLYALDAALGDLAAPTKVRLEAAMKGHVLGEARLMGTYAKKRL